MGQKAGLAWFPQGLLKCPEMITLGFEGSPLQDSAAKIVSYIVALNKLQNVWFNPYGRKVFLKVDWEHRKMLHLNEPIPMVTELYLDAMPSKDRVTQMLSQNAGMKKYPVYPCPHAAPSMQALLSPLLRFQN